MYSDKDFIYWQFFKNNVQMVFNSCRLNISVNNLPTPSFLRITATCLSIQQSLQIQALYWRGATLIVSRPKYLHRWISGGVAQRPRPSCIRWKNNDQAHSPAPAHSPSSVPIPSLYPTPTPSPSPLGHLTNSSSDTPPSPFTSRASNSSLALTTGSNLAQSRSGSRTWEGAEVGAGEGAGLGARTGAEAGAGWVGAVGTGTGAAIAATESEASATGPGAEAYLYMSNH